MRKPGDRATDVTPIARAEPSLFEKVCLRCPQDFRLRRGGTGLGDVFPLGLSGRG